MGDSTPILIIPTRGSVPAALERRAVTQAAQLPCPCSGQSGARALGRLRQGWEGQLELGAAGRRVADLQGAMMEIDRLLDDGEAEARTLAGGRTLFEGLQKVGDEVVAQPRPAVFDNDGPGGTRGDSDVSARRGVANGVLQEVAQGLAYGNCVADDRRWLPHGEGNPVLRAGGPILQAVDQIGGNLAEIEFAGFELLYAFEPCEREQAIDRVAHPLHVPLQILDARLVPSELEHHHRQRGPQLVRRTRDEHALRLHQAADPVEKLIDGAGEDRRLARHARYVETLGPVERRKSSSWRAGRGS